MVFRTFCQIHGDNAPHSRGQCILCRYEREENKLIKIFEKWKQEKDIEKMIFDLFCRIKKLEGKSDPSDIIG